MTALLVICALIAFVIFTIRRSPVLSALFGIFLPILFPFLFSRRPPQQSGGAATLSEDEAREVLGVSPYASRDDIIAAHHRLMKQMHPDLGGSSYFAARINLARDTLLKNAGVTIENTPEQ